MERKLLLTVFCVTMKVGVMAQVGVSINDDGTGANPQSLLDLNVNAPTGANRLKGVLLPRMSTADRDNATYGVNPGTGDVGLMIYNTTTSTYQYWDGTTWIDVGTGTGNASTLDEAYDGGGAGLGRTINAVAGNVEIQGSGHLTVAANVGIGTTSPAAKLEVQFTGQGGILLDGNDSGDAQIELENGGGSHLIFDDQSDNNNFKLQSSAGRSIVFNTDGANERMAVQSDGRLRVNNLGDPSGAVIISNPAGILSKTPLTGGANDVLIGTGVFTDANNLSINTAGGWTDDGAVVRLTTVGDNVGIGTTTPVEKLQVDGDLRVVSNSDVSNTVGSGAIRINNTANDRGLSLDYNEIQTIGEPLYLQNENAQDLNVGQGDLFVETGAGNVGVGTTTPMYKLAVNGSNSDTSPVLGLQSGNDNNGFNNGAQIAFGYNGTDDYQHFIQTRHNTASVQNAIDFYVSDGTQNNTVTSGSVHNLSLVSGNVGIGTTAPSQKLHVSDATSGDGGWDDGGILIQNTGSAGEAALSYRNSESGANYWITGLNQSPHLDIAYGGSFTNGNTFVRVQNDGNVGLGTVTPTTQLHTTGGVRFETLTGIGTRFVVADANGNLSVGSATTSGIVTGSGTANYLARWTPDGSTLGIGATRDDGTNVGVGTAPVTGRRLAVAGDVLATAGSFITSDGGAANIDHLWNDDGNSSGTGNGVGTWNFVNDAAEGALGNAGIRAGNLYMANAANVNQFAGNVGVGTSPTTTLDVEDAVQLPLNLVRTGNVGDVGIEFHDNDANAQTGYFTFNHRDGSSQSNGSSFHFTTTEPTLGVIVDGPGGYYADSQLALRSNGNSFLTGGNLGIGTNSPSEDLHIWSDTDASIWLEADANNATESDNPYIKLTQDGQLVNAIFGLTGASGVDPEGNVYAGALNNGLLLGTTTTNAPLQLGVGNSAEVTISTTSNVGFGTTSPTEKLHVVGTGRFSNLSGTGNRLVTADANGVLGNSTSFSIGQGVSEYTTAAEAWLTGNNTGTFSYAAGAGWTPGTWQNVSGFTVTRNVTAGNAVHVSASGLVEADNYNYYAPSCVYFRLMRGGIELARTSVYLTPASYVPSNFWYFTSGGFSFDAIDTGVSGNQTYTVQYWVPDEHAATEYARIGSRRLNVIELRQ